MTKRRDGVAEEERDITLMMRETPPGVLMCDGPYEVAGNKQDVLKKGHGQN